LPQTALTVSVPVLLAELPDVSVTVNVVEPAGVAVVVLTVSVTA
jgi:hypothetical protein